MKRIIIIILFLCLTASAQEPYMKPMLGKQINWGHPLAKGLVGCWVMNEGCGNTIYDLTLNNNTGTFVGDVSWNIGECGDTLNFPGSDDYIDLSGVMPIVPTESWTMIGTVTPKGTGSYPIAFGIYDTGSAQHVGIGLDTGTYDLKVISSGETPGSGTTLTANTRYHLALVYDGTKFYAYLNGVEDYNVTPSGSNWQSSDEFEIGWNHNHDAWNGDIDYVALYDRALTPSEIDQLYQEPFCMFVDDLPVALMYNYAGAAPKGQVISVQMSDTPLFVTPFLIILFIAFMIKGAKHVE